LCRTALALRAMTVTARVVADLQVVAVRAAQCMAT
jgi:hypothetical protein